MKTPSHPLALSLIVALAGFCSTASAQTSPLVDPDLVSLEKFEITGTRPHTTDITSLKLPAPVLDTAAQRHRL